MKKMMNAKKNTEETKRVVEAVNEIMLLIKDNVPDFLSRSRKNTADKCLDSKLRIIEESDLDLEEKITKVNEAAEDADKKHAQIDKDLVDLIVFLVKSIGLPVLRLILEQKNPKVAGLLNLQE